MARTAPTTPHRQLTGHLHDADRVGAVAAALVAAGVPARAVHATAGSEALAEVDPAGTGHGLRGVLTRAVEQLGQEGAEHRAAAEAVRDGAALLVVDVDDEVLRARAVEVLAAHGVRRLRWWGDLGIEAVVAPSRQGARRSTRQPSPSRA